MTRQHINGITNHPKKEALFDYEYGAPEGSWTGRLDDRAWGKSSNLFCYFTNLATGGGHRLSVFNRQSYKPYRSGPAFDQVTLGTAYEIETEVSKDGFPKFLSAEPGVNIYVVVPEQEPLAIILVNVICVDMDDLNR